MQLTEVAFRGRRQLLSRIADGSGFLTLRFFHFSAQQQNGLDAGRAHPLLRRGATRARAAWNSCIRNTGGSDAAAAADRELHLTPDLSDHGGGDPGAAAPAGRAGAR